MRCLSPFLDELEKIAVKLTQGEERGQTAKFTGLGAAALPAITGLKNLIQEGRVTPKGMGKGRWLVGNMVGGALMGGALPAMRHQLERQTQDKARARQRAEREARNV